MGSSDTPNFTPELLRAYSTAALQNANELLEEASLLRDSGHMARAYFLAVACIEETGKALQAFDAQNRNLSDPALCTKLKTGMEQHSQKINYALGSWALHSSDLSGALKTALDLILNLKRGREPSMYSGLRSDPDRVESPREVVRPDAARGCVRLATDCLAYARYHLAEKTPPNVTSAQDKLFTMKSTKFQQMLKTEDFWWYFISRMEAGDKDLAEAVLGYERDYIKRDLTFQPPNDSEAAS